MPSKNPQIAVTVFALFIVLLLSTFISCMGIFAVGSIFAGNDASTVIGDIKNLGDIFQAFATIGAIILGGIWTLVLFQWRRERLPKASIEHQVTVRDIQDDNYVVHVSIVASNIGQVLLHCSSLTMWIQRVRPIDQITKDYVRDYVKNKTAKQKDADNLIPWPAIAVREETWNKNKKVLEPGESHQFWYDFIIPSDIQTFRLYSYLTVFDHPNLGWPLASIHEINPQTKNITSEFTKLIGIKPE